ncbi:hypothetical protein B296_00002202 [Ensete ventricosum]|uniref:Uncharacterized protein n=1 Tax=Ensete ventricosum TaxID=4639 RepID=A0A427BAC8_ENSVE|nr:hypothetical protein B296_00002202 [Ensete ventricosum]
MLRSGVTREWVGEGELSNDPTQSECSHSLNRAGKSEDKAECKVTDSRVLGLAAPWYRRDKTSVESSIPCSHGGRALVIKEVEEVENAEANSKY